MRNGRWETRFENCALGTSYGAWWEGIINRISD